MQSERNKLNLLLSTQNEELNSWKIRCSQLEQENMDLKSQEIYIRELETKLSKLHKKFEEKDNEMDILSKKYIQEKSLEINNNNNHISSSLKKELQQNEAFYQNEIKKLYDILNQKNAELNYFKSRNFNNSNEDINQINFLRNNVRELEEQVKFTYFSHFILKFNLT